MSDTGRRSNETSRQNDRAEECPRGEERFDPRRVWRRGETHHGDQTERGRTERGARNASGKNRRAASRGIREPVPCFQGVTATRNQHESGTRANQWTDGSRRRNAARTPSVPARQRGRATNSLYFSSRRASATICATRSSPSVLTSTPEMSRSAATACSIEPSKNVLTMCSRAVLRALSRDCAGR